MRSRSNGIVAALAALALLALAWLAVSLGRGGPPDRPVGVRQVVAEHVEAKDAVSTSLQLPREVRDDPPAGEVFEREVPEPTGATLTGRVTGLEDGYGYDEVRVALWRERTVPNCEQFAIAGPRSRALRVVRAASDGSFAFEDLDSESRFHLRAGGAGQASLWLPEPVSPAEGPVVLDLARVKGLHVELVGTDGAPPRTPPELLEDEFVLSGSEVHRRGASLEPWEQELVGIPGTGCQPDVSPHGRLLVLSSPPHHMSLGPIKCYAALPGYAYEHPTYWAHLITDRVPIEKLVLRPTAAGWGSIEIELVGLSDELRRQFADEDPVGGLILEFEDATSYPLKLLGPAALRRFDGLPHGDARWVFESYDARCRRPADGGLAIVRIGDQVARMSIDLSQTGGLRVELDSGGRPDSAPFHSTSITSEWGHEIRLPSERLPHLFLLLESGEWRQSSISERDPETGTLLLHTFDDGTSVRLEPGRIATLELPSTPDAYAPRSR